MAMEKWHEAQARQDLRNEVTRLLRQTQHYLEGKILEWQRNSSYYIVCQNTMFSDGDMVVLVLRARASDDSIKKLAEYYESLQYEEKVMVESQTP
jgi:cytochrome c553